MSGSQKSWNNDKVLNELLLSKKFNTVIDGVIRQIKNVSTVIDGGTVEKQLLVITLTNGAIVYCPTEDFAEYQHKNYMHFVGQVHPFLVVDVNLEAEVVTVSGKKATKIKIDEFWARVDDLKSRNALSHEVMQGTVTSVNKANRVVHLEIMGQTAYIPRSEWSWSKRELVDAEPGEKIDVVIQKAVREENRVQVSRKETMPDPFEHLATLKQGDLIAGKISEVHPIHGIFVTLENGIDVKGSKPADLEQPSVNDIVTCRVRDTLQRNAKGDVYGRVIILNYPNGKKKRKDLGAFLFE